MNYSVHQQTAKPVLVGTALTQFILDRGIVIGVYDCINKARRALGDHYGDPCVLINDNATGDYLLVDLT